MSRRALPSLALALLLSGCGAATIDGEEGSANGGKGDSADGTDTVSSADEALSACAHNDGKAYRNIPSDDVYFITTFGGPQDGASTQEMSCGGKADGKSFYIADRQRFERGGRCGGARKVKITGTDSKGVTRCVYAVAADYGPAGCVEDAAKKPVIDASPAITLALFGVSRAGWSDRRPVIAVPAPDDAPLGKDCTPAATDPKPPATSAPSTSATTCFSSTWNVTMKVGECVQSVHDQRWYQCTAGRWTTIESSYPAGSPEALLEGGDAGPCTITHAL